MIARNCGVDLGCWMKTSALPRSSTTDVIATCRFTLPTDKVPTGDAIVVVVVVWVLGFIGSMAGCHLTASSYYVAYSFPSKQIK